MSDLILPEDITTEEQIRRCRDVLASNLCAKGVRALPSESLPQLIAKVSKIDQQQRHIDTLKNYASNLKMFAQTNIRDYAISNYTNYLYSDGSKSSSNGSNYGAAYSYFLIPTTFTFNGKSYNVPRSDVIFITGTLEVPWGSSASNYYWHIYYPQIYAPRLNEISFDALKSTADYSAYGRYGGTMSTYYYNTASVSRDGDYYRFYTYPYNSTYDYWCGNTSSSLNYAYWAFKLPLIGVSPNISFPTDPVIPKQEYYY
jgi:hypothetical protein